MDATVSPLQRIYSDTNVTSIITILPCFRPLKVLRPGDRRLLTIPRRASNPMPRHHLHNASRTTPPTQLYRGDLTEDLNTERIEPPPGKRTRAPLRMTDLQ